MKKTNNSSNLLISVIVPTYNREKKIRKSLESVLNQTYTNIEVIVVDDGSTDHTIQCIQSINDTRIRIIQNKENKGPAVSRNIGVLYAKGSFIAFNDSDDIWNCDKLDKQMKYLKKHKNMDMVYCRYTYITENHTQVIPDLNIPKEELEGSIFHSLLKSNKVGTPTMLMKKEIFEKAGCFDEELKALEDWDLALKIANYSEIGFVEEELVTAYGEKTGVNSNDRNLINSLIHIIEKFNDDKKNLEDFKETILFLMEKITRNRDVIDFNQYREKMVPKIIKENLEFDLLVSALEKKIKMEDNYHLTLKLSNDNETLEMVQNYFTQRDWKRIAIYGHGNIGQLFEKLIKNTKISVCYFIDRNEVGKNIRLVHEIDSVPDVIIITLTKKNSELETMIKEKSRSQIVYIGDIVK